MNVVRRAIALVLFVVSLLSGLAGWQAIATASPAAVEADPVFPLLSPRRVPGLGADIVQEASLRRSVGATLGPDRSVSCVEIRRNERRVFASNPERSLIPASTTKLLTATAALNIFDDDHRFETVVKTDTKPKDGEVNGPLYLIGGGDPLLFTDDYVQSSNGHRDIHSSMETLADDVVAKGIKVVNGSVVGDDTRFDTQRYLSSWEPGYRASGQVGPVSALAVNQGFAVATRATADDPAQAAASVFTDLLRQRGIVVRDGAVSAPGPAEGNTVAELRSVPMTDIVREMLTESDNTTAEVLLKNIGVQTVKRGTFVDGARSIVTDLRQTGFPIDGVEVVDGSGLDRSNRLTCALVTEVLARSGSSGPIASGLARAGETGTLQRRFVGTPAVGRLQAKTGTLAGVSGLAGWARPAEQQPFEFVVVTNGLPSGRSRAIEEQIALTLVQQPKTANLPL